MIRHLLYIAFLFLLWFLVNGAAETVICYYDNRSPYSFFTSRSKIIKDCAKSHLLFPFHF